MELFIGLKARVLDGDGDRDIARRRAQEDGGDERHNTIPRYGTRRGFHEVPLIAYRTTRALGYNMTVQCHERAPTAQLRPGCGRSEEEQEFWPAGNGSDQ